MMRFTCLRPFTIMACVVGPFVALAVGCSTTTTIAPPDDAGGNDGAGGNARDAGADASEPQSDADASNDPHPDAGDAKEACEGVASARCNLRMTCTSGGSISRTFGGLTTCIERETTSCMLSVLSGDSGQTPAGAKACATAYATLPCEDFFNNNLPAACNPTGKRALNRTCAVSSQCQSGYCNNDKAALCGTCDNAPPVGAKCLTANCASGQICDLRTDTCLSPEAAGATCDNNSQPCGFGLACAGNSGGKTGTCTAQTGQDGDDCSTAPIVYCDAKSNLACTGAAGSRTCRVAVDATDGQPCGSLDTGSVACSAGGNCYTSAGAIAKSGESGTCKAAAAEGAACDLTAGPPCLPPARCVVSGTATGGKCTTPAPDACDP